MFTHWIPDVLVRWFARPYVAGDRLEDALDVAHQLWSRGGIVTTLDLLAEQVRSVQRIQENLETYRTLLDVVAKDARFTDSRSRPTVSLKPSSFTLSPLDHGGDGTGSREAIEVLARQARELRVPLTIDMEDHSWTDFTLDLAIDLYQRGFDIGTVLQTRLHRTQRDLDRIPRGMRIRLVIGIYLEPASIALTDKAAMKVRLVEQAAVLLERGVYVEFASHDEACVRRFFAEIVVPRRISGSQFEVQMLFGVPRAALLQRIQNGELSPPGVPAPAVRLYVPYATAWDQATAYCRRRLHANPDLALYVARNVLGILAGKRPGIGQYLDGNGPP